MKDISGTHRHQTSNSAQANLAASSIAALRRATNHSLGKPRNRESILRAGEKKPKPQHDCTEPARTWELGPRPRYKRPRRTRVAGVSTPVSSIEPSFGAERRRCHHVFHGLIGKLFVRRLLNPPQPCPANRSWRSVKGGDAGPPIAVAAVRKGEIPVVRTGRRDKLFLYGVRG